MPGKDVTIRTFNNKAEALIAKAKVEAAGIECKLLGGDSLIDLQWINASSKGYALQVAEADFKRAVKLLNEPEPE